MSESSDSEHDSGFRAQNADGLEVTSLSIDHLQKLIDGKGLGKCRKPVWKFVSSRLTDKDYVKKVKLFLIKRGHYLIHLHLVIDEVSEREKLSIRDLMKSIFTKSKKLKGITLDYYSTVDVPIILHQISEYYKKGLIKNLIFLRLNSDNPGIGICKTGVESIITLGPRLEQLQIEEIEGDAFDSAGEPFRTLLETYSNCLVGLKLGRVYKCQACLVPLKLEFPNMTKLTRLEISASWAACNAVGDNQTDEYFQIENISNLPCLKYLNFGHFVQITSIPHSVLQNLKTVECENQWNNSVNLVASEGDYKATFLQFPNSLNDPEFVLQVSRRFTNLTDISLSFPSQPVLHAFFKYFEGSVVKNLSIEFQFDFPLMLESCLFPEIFPTTNSFYLADPVFKILNKYRFQKSFCEHFFVEFPVDDNHPNKQHSGLRGLKNIQKLHLSYIVRENLPVPAENEFRHWTDPQYQAYKENRIGTCQRRNYRFDCACHEQILQLNLQEYTWANLPNLDAINPPEGYNPIPKRE